MWANLLNILSRSGVGSCLTLQDMRDEANNFVMGLLFLSGDWGEGSGGPGQSPGGQAGWKGGQAAFKEPARASTVLGPSRPPLRVP